MTNSKATKRALVSSALAILMCVAMLVGTTFAWFTDTASTAVNKIQAGKLDVALEMKNAGGNWVNAEGETLGWVAADGRAQDKILWEPGCTYQLPELRIVNKGNLALKYRITINGIVGNAKLLDAINFTYGTGIDINAEGHLLPGATTEGIIIKGHMKESAGNEYQGLSIDGIGITVVATQDTVEADSFGNRYDADAPYEIVRVSNEKELRTALYNAPTDGTGVKIVMQDDITLDMYYSALLFAHSNTADKWQHGGGLSAENAAIEAAKPENNEVPDYSTAYDTLAHYKTAVNGWDTVSSDLAEQAKFGANFPMSATNPVSRLVVKPGQDVIIDLNGHTIAKNALATMGDWSNVCTDIIGNYGTLTVMNSNTTGGTVKGLGYISCGGAVLHNYASAKLVVGNNVTIDGNAQGMSAKSGQYVISNEGGTCIIDGATVSDVEADKTNPHTASLLHNASGKMIIKGSTVLNHPASKVINCKGGEVIVESATIKSDVYAVYAKGGTVTITDSAVTVVGDGTMTEAGGKIIKN